MPKSKKRKKSAVKKKKFSKRIHSLKKKINKKLRKIAKRGFSMIEVMVAIAIIGGMIVGTTVAIQAAQSKARDGERKTHLERIKVAFEDYYNDNGCYPDETILNNCNSADFAPYINSIPCDPITDQPYLYVPNSNVCTGYRVYAALENDTDPEISQLGCDTAVGCGWGEEFNYGISSGVTVYDPNGSGAGAGVGSSPSPSASPGPSGPTYVYACDASGVCNQYEEGHPDLLSCPVTFEQPNCNNECGNPALRCN